MLANDLESEVLAISSKSQKELLNFIIELLQNAKLVGEQDIDEFIDKHKNYQEASITKEEYEKIKKLLKQKNIEFSVLMPDKKEDNYKLLFKFGDSDKVAESFKKLASLKIKSNSLNKLIKESLKAFNSSYSKSIDEKIKVQEFNLDER